MTDYETNIGVEVHIELNTHSKLFCGCRNAFGERPNTNVCPVCTGMPGTLPVLNRRALEMAVRVGLALNCDISREVCFDRKNYYYPDNPQNYQITQQRNPIAAHGHVDIEGGKRVRIKELHMEEDAGKLIHCESETVSLVDYNRAGVPLIEIVTEPDMGTAEETVEFLKKLRLIIKYLGVSDCKLQEGSMRADVNLSVRRPGGKMGVRTEMKNLNSFRAVKRAVEAEKRRQAGIIGAGGSVLQEARRWDDLRGESFSMRLKETLRDYMYFPDPDLPVLKLSDGEISELEKSLPEFREEKAKRFIKEYGIPEYDALLLTEYPAVADLFEKTVKECGSDRAGEWPMAKSVSNRLMTDGLRLCREKGTDPDDMKVSPRQLAVLVMMQRKGEITSNVAGEIFEALFEADTDPREYAAERGLLIRNDEDELRGIIKKAIEENPGAVADYKAGKTKAAGYIVGQVMKATRGSAAPQVLNRLLRELI